jgi:cell division transport system permease protein
MTFLAMMAVAASFTLSAMTHRWSSGLENRMTVEIPATDTDGNLRNKETVDTIAASAMSVLESHPAVLESKRMSDTDIRKLVEPWLGTNLLNDAIPLPALIAVAVRPDTDAPTMGHITISLRNIAPNIRVDTHQEWLQHLLRFTGAMRLGAVILSLVIGITTITAVAGAVRSRMAIHRADVELLHIMGASDGYITRQFQRHALILAFKGGLAGALAGALTMVMTGWLSGEMGVAILPDFSLSHVQIAALCITPLLAAVIAATTARFTVLRVLSATP